MAICKTSELNEKQLNHLVAQIEDFDTGDWLPDYSTDWAAGGTIIEREGISIKENLPSMPDNRWNAFPSRSAKGAGGKWGAGPTPLIAAMRCYVASKLGDEVEIPEELK